jgi:hypothetical protein
MATPALSGGVLYVRGMSTLVAIGKKPSGPYPVTSVGWPFMFKPGRSLESARRERVTRTR